MSLFPALRDHIAKLSIQNLLVTKTVTMNGKQQVYATKLYTVQNVQNVQIDWIDAHPDAYYLFHSNGCVYFCRNDFDDDYDFYE